jgi:ADP-heptose:LPS heptosyltransferase
MALPPPAAIDKIAVVRANGIGDYLFAEPALSALAAAYPQAEIVLLGKPWHARCLTNRPGAVDRVVVIPAYGGVSA